MRTIAIVLSLALMSTAAAAQTLVNLTGQDQCVGQCAMSEAGASNAMRMGAIYSPDSMTIRFDSEPIWQRALELPPPPAPRRHR
jgi:hypothetical protein